MAVLVLQPDMKPKWPDLQHLSHCLIDSSSNYFQNLFPFYRLKISLSSNSAGITPSTIIWSIRSVIISSPAWHAGFTISDSNSDCPAAFTFFILLIGSITMSLSIRRYTLLTPCSEASRDNFSQLFSYFHHTLPSYFIVNIKQISHIALVFPWLNLNKEMPAGLFTVY